MYVTPKLQYSLCQILKRCGFGNLNLFLRYVGCSGAQNEDDYEQHELMMFMLREGQLQRCQSCGQVFKLVRLRNEYSPEMDYYMSNLIPYEVQEMGEMDQTINMSLLRFQKDSYEHSQFEVPTNQVYSLVNPDEHDRLLTDPAYRLEKTKLVQDKFQIYVYSLNEIEKEFIEQNGPLTRLPINKVDYETLIDCEMAIMKLDRHFNRVQKFERRKFIDRKNHDRREKRMLQRVAERWDNNYTFYYGNTNEEEQKFKDYFETDLEQFPDHEAIEAKIDEMEIAAQGDYNLDRFDFQEGYTRQPEEDASSILEKIVFKFKYRMMHSSPEEHEKREQRMIERHMQRIQDSNYQEILIGYSQSLAMKDSQMLSSFEKEYLELIATEAVHQYKDYFEDDTEEKKNFYIFDELGGFEKAVMIKGFENFATSLGDSTGYFTFPTRKWNADLGFWSNVVADMRNARNFVPAATDVATTISLQESQFVGKEELEALSGYQLKVSDAHKKDIASADKLESEIKQSQIESLIKEIEEHQDVPQKKE